MPDLPISASVWLLSRVWTVTRNTLAPTRTFFKKNPWRWFIPAGGQHKALITLVRARILIMPRHCAYCPRCVCTRAAPAGFLSHWHTPQQRHKDRSSQEPPAVVLLQRDTERRRECDHARAPPRPPPTLSPDQRHCHHHPPAKSFHHFYPVFTLRVGPLLRHLHIDNRWASWVFCGFHYSGAAFILNYSHYISAVIFNFAGKRKGRTVCSQHLTKAKSSIIPWTLFWSLFLKAQKTQHLAGGVDPTWFFNMVQNH